MRRVWLRWLLLAVFVVAIGFTFVSLGNWQLDRLYQRRDRNANVASHEQAEVVPFSDTDLSQINLEKVRKGKERGAVEGPVEGSLEGGGQGQPQTKTTPTSQHRLGRGQ